MGNIEKLMDAMRAHGVGVAMPVSDISYDVWGSAVQMSNMNELLNRSRRAHSEAKDHPYMIHGADMVTLLTRKLVERGGEVSVVGMLGILSGLSSDEELVQMYLDNEVEVGRGEIKKVMGKMSCVRGVKRGGGLRMVVKPGEMGLFAEALVNGGVTSEASRYVYDVNGLRVAISGINKRLGRWGGAKFVSVGGGEYVLRK